MHNPATVTDYFPTYDQGYVAGIHKADELTRMLRGRYRYGQPQQQVLDDLLDLLQAALNTPPSPLNKE